ncbi:hypothetical protein AU577_16865 [Salmonella enterica subsp. enterica serovar Alachua]|nr:hypothetical protein [Salmonella enterica subsp. enterica serovar Alachua]
MANTKGTAALDINSIAEGAQFSAAEAAAVKSGLSGAGDIEIAPATIADALPGTEGLPAGMVQVVVMGSTFHLGNKTYVAGNVLSLKQKTADKYIKLGWVKALDKVKYELAQRNKSGTISVSAG